MRHGTRTWTQRYFYTPNRDFIYFDELLLYLFKYGNQMRYRFNVRVCMSLPFNYLEPELRDSGICRRVASLVPQKSRNALPMNSIPHPSYSRIGQITVNRLHRTVHVSSGCLILCTHVCRSDWPASANWCVQIHSTVFVGRRN